MNGFWALAARDWPGGWPAHELVRSIGRAQVERLRAAELLREVPLRPYDSVSCAECRRTARVLFERAGAVAVCTGPDLCPDEELGPAPTRLVLDPVPFAVRLADALALDGAPGKAAVVTTLGRRRIGDEEVGFDLCSHPHSAGLAEGLTRAARGGPAVRVVLVPDLRRLPGDVPTAVGDVDLVWAGLNEVVAVDERVSVDLRPVLARRRFRGLPDAPPFAGLAFNGSGVAWAGTVILPPARGVAVQLLEVLSERPGEWFTRRDLWRRLWPEEHTASGELPRGANPDRFDGRLRMAVTEARAGFRAVGLALAIENQRGDEATGGYRLALRPSQVQPPNALATKPESSCAKQHVDQLNDGRRSRRVVGAS